MFYHLSGSFSTLLVSFHLQRHMGDFVIQVSKSLPSKKNKYLCQGVWSLYSAGGDILGIILA